MSLASFIFDNKSALDRDLKKRVFRQAQAEGKSVSKWVANAVREKLDRIYKEQLRASRTAA